MTRGELMERYGMKPHVEGGLYKELFREDLPADVRNPHAVIYYALGPGEHADFHAIDCDEYWLYHSGGTLEIWSYEPDGTRTVHLFGVEDGAQPCVLLKAGCLFGARPVNAEADPTFLSCVTVPQFSYEHYTLLTREEMLKLHPDAEAFFE